MRRNLGMAAVAAALLLAGCGEDVGDPPDFSASETPARWNPCDALDAAFIADQFGSDAEPVTGTPTQPECRFVPAEDSGQPAITANYLLYPAGLEATFAEMDLAEAAVVRSLEIEGADDARIIINAGVGHLGVTGFVQNGALIQSVDVVAPEPFERQRVVAGVSAVLKRFSAHAEASDAGSSR